MHVVGLALWGLFLVAAVFYTRRARHPKSRPFAAYMVFVTVFTVTSFVLFASVTILLMAADRPRVLEDPLGGLLFLAVVFVPAFLAARWQLRKAPRQPSGPPDGS